MIPLARILRPALLRLSNAYSYPSLTLGCTFCNYFNDTTHHNNIKLSIRVQYIFRSTAFLNSHSIIKKVGEKNIIIVALSGADTLCIWQTKYESHASFLNENDCTYLPSMDKMSRWSSSFLSWAKPLKQAITPCNGPGAGVFLSPSSCVLLLLHCRSDDAFSISFRDRFLSPMILVDDDIIFIFWSLELQKRKWQ